MESTSTTNHISFLCSRSHSYDLLQTVIVTPCSSYRKLHNSGVSGYLARPMSFPLTCEKETVRQGIKKSRSVPGLTSFGFDRRSSEEHTNFLPEFKSGIGTIPYVPTRNASNISNRLYNMRDVDYASSDNICDESIDSVGSDDNPNSFVSAESVLNVTAEENIGGSILPSSVDLQAILSRVIKKLEPLKGNGLKTKALLKTNETEKFPDPGSDSFSNDKCYECEKAIDSQENANEFFVSDSNDSNLSAMKNAERSQISSIVDLQGILNNTKLRSLKEIEGKDVLQESPPIETMSPKCPPNDSNNYKESNFGSHTELGTETKKLPIVSIGLDNLQNKDMSLVLDGKNANNGEKIANTPGQLFLFSDIRKDRIRFLERVYETIDDESDNEDIIGNEQESNARKINIDGEQSENIINQKDEVHLLKSEDSDSLKKQRSRNDSSTSSETYKIESDGNEDTVGERFFDETWINFADRPLLPLKPYQKQKSLSCTNLVQTIKGFSKRNSADNNRFLSSETTGKILSETKEICSSDDDVSKHFKTIEPQFEDPKPWNKDEIFKSLAIKNYIWYHQVDAKEASKRLLIMEQDGVFLIRPASKPTKTIHHTLCVTYNHCAYNMYIRNLSNGLIALGKRRKDEMTFSSMLEMIQFHQIVPISLHFVHADKEAHVYLLITPPK